MRTLLIIIAISISGSSFAQFFNKKRVSYEPAQYIVRYSLEYKPDSNNLEQSRKEEMLLLIGENLSKFSCNNHHRFDTIMLRVDNHKQFRALMSDRNNPLPLSGFQYFILKNHPKGKITQIEHTLDGTCRFEEELNPFNWQLQAEKDSIHGYHVQIALCSFGGRDWEAWFTPEIPLNDGPYKFNGLPGLILKIQDTRHHYVFDFISINKPMKPLMIDHRDKEFLNLTKEKFFRMKDAYRADIINRVKEKGASSKTQEVAARNMARRNNPIELKRK